MAEGSLEDRTRKLIADFDREDKGYAFNDSGDGTVYAEQFAGLLREWLKVTEWREVMEARDG